MLPAAVFAQSSLPTDITGLWKGTLYNDTTKQFYKYEVGISKEKGKYIGFSHTYFMLDDKQYFGVKKVKIKIAGDGKIIIEDDELIANNYPVPPNKNVRQLNVLTLNAKDSVMIMTGPYTTNRTKEYHALTGSISLERKNDYWQSALVPHLQELGKVKQLSFVKELETSAVVAAPVGGSGETSGLAKQQAAEKIIIEKEIAQKEATQKLLAKQQAEEKSKADKELAKQEAAAKARIEKEIAQKEATQKLLAKQQAEDKAKAEKELAKLQGAERVKAEKELAEKEAAQKLLAKQQAEEKARMDKELAEKEAAQKLLAKQDAEEKAAKDKELAKELAKQEAFKEQQAKQKAAEIAAKKAESEKVLAKQQADAEVMAEKEKALQELVKKAAPASGVSNRTTVLQQTVNFTSDSLQLTLYDNGEVDGDTVSVLLNGQIIIAKQGLSTTAFKKTIYIPHNTDKVELVMYAESLGSIPPNTGLLVVKDGKDLYEIRFSGDLQKNASIVFNRKKE